MANTELVPQIPQEGVQKAIAELETLKLRLSDYEQRAKALVVQDARDYSIAGELLKQVRDARKGWAWTMAPLKSIAKTIGDKFRTMELEGANKCDRIEKSLQVKMVAQKQRERDAALAEERRINEERQREAARVALEQKKIADAQAEAERKKREKEIAAQARAGELSKKALATMRTISLEIEEAKKAQALLEAQATVANVQNVRVEANTPKISGLRQRVNWFWRTVDEDKIPRSFMMADGKTIGQFVRNAKSKEVSETAIPGIEVWSEDAI
jgi:hypothetical protein